MIREDYGAKKGTDDGLRLVEEEIIDRVKAGDTQIKEQGFTISHNNPADHNLWKTDQGKRFIDMHTKEGVYWKQANKTRIEGWQKVRSMLKASLEGDREKPGLYFLENSQNAFEKLMDAVRDENHREDVSDKCSDHAPDMIRYATMRVKHETKRAKLRF